MRGAKKKLFSKRRIIIFAFFSSCPFFTQSKQIKKISGFDRVNKTGFKMTAAEPYLQNEIHCYLLLIGIYSRHRLM